MLSTEKQQIIDLDLDKYVRNLRIFYSKIIGGHPQQGNLQKKFKFLIENQANKWRSGLFTSTPDENSVRSFLSKARSLQPKKTQKKIFQWLMQTDNFTRAFLFGCLLSLLEAKSKDGIRMIKQNLQIDDVFIQGKVFKGNALRKIIYSWSKVQKLFQNTFNAKPHITIADCLNDFCIQFIDMLYRVFTEGKIKMMQLGDINQERLKKLAETIKINIIYFELQGIHVKTTLKCGEYKKNIHIGYLLDQKIYVVAKQLPKKPKQEVQKQKTLIKLSQVSKDLFKMYQNSDIKIKNLDTILSINQKNNRTMAIGLPKAPSKIQSKLSRSNSLGNQSILSAKF